MISKGRKDDKEKLRMDLIPVEAIEEIAKVLGFGAKKYGDRDWEKGLSWSRYYGAALRHLTAWWGGEDKDSETGLSHVAHALCCVLILSTYERRGMILFDDRPKRGEQDVH